MVWAWLWTACLSAWLSSHIICGFTEKLQLWLFWPSFMAFSTFPGSNQSKLFDGPSLVRALFPETHQPAETYWPLLAVFSAIRAAVFDLFFILFTCGHVCQPGSTLWFFLHTGCWTDLRRQPLVYIQCLTGGANGQVSALYSILRMQKKK